jgi:energy-coupling factor transport system permease protein
MRSLPLGLYLEKPITWIHRLDARVKLLWLLGFLLAPILAPAVWRLGIALLLIAFTLWARIPVRVWRQQMGWLLAVASFVVLLTAIAPDGYALSYQPRQPSAAELAPLPVAKSSPAIPNTTSVAAPEATAPEATAADDPSPSPPAASSSPTSPAAVAELPQPTDYRYILVKQWRFQVSRRSLGVGVRLGTLVFILIYSTNLYLLTTSPEEITAGLESLMAPLRRFHWPITEIALTLTLSLRFIPLVLEEVQNLVRAIRTRAIDWKKIGLRGAIQIWIVLAERLFDNLLLRAAQIASAMKVRGFSTPEDYRVEYLELRLRRGDWWAIAVLILCLGARLTWGWQT